MVDSSGMACSITFSDPLNYSPIMPGTGLLVSNRGMQAWADPEHPNRVRPGQRPLVTGNPVLVFEGGKLRMALGSPGADVQVQAILQVLFNVLLFGMDCQQAVEAPRFATYSHPNSFEPHGYEPGVLRVESTVPAEVRKELKDLGHRVVGLATVRLAGRWHRGYCCRRGWHAFSRRRSKARKLCPGVVSPSSCADGVACQSAALSPEVHSSLTVGHGEHATSPG